MPLISCKQTPNEDYYPASSQSASANLSSKAVYGGCMRYFSIAVLISFALTVATGQTTSQSVPASDAQAVLLAQKSLAALTGGVQISDVTLNANVVSNIGPNYNTGTGTFKAKGTGESRVDLSVLGDSETDVRNLTNGAPTGAWARDTASGVPYATHNCWTDAAWFFPALSSLTQTANPNFIFRYVGSESHNGVPTQHIQFFQVGSNGDNFVQRLSTTDVFLDSGSGLPLDITFNGHADDNMNVNIPIEIRFANYQSVNGIQIPMHFQELVNGGVILDVKVTGAIFNSGISDTLFTIQNL